MLSRLSVEIITKEETPNARQGRMTLSRGRRLGSRSRSRVRSPQRKRMTHTALTPWLRTVATAAPDTPMFRPKMRMGSRMMLHTAPITVVNMLNLAKPWVVMKGFMPSTTSTNTLPST